MQHPEVIFWTDEYNKYLVNQLSEGSDGNLSKHPDVGLILDYASIYLYELEEKRVPQHDLPSGMNDNTSYWYYISNKQLSTSFIRVADFYSFYSSRVSKSDTASRATAVKTVKEGDVVLLKRASTGARYHAIYISKKSGSKAYYCGHTSARKDYDFDNINDSDNDYTILKFNSYSNN